jgi:hypothetical protein
VSLSQKSWRLALLLLMGAGGASAQTGPVNIPGQANYWNGDYVGTVDRTLVAGDYLLTYKGLADNAPGDLTYQYDAWSCCSGGGFVNQYFVQTSAGMFWSGTIENGGWKQFSTAQEALSVAKASLTPITLHLAQAETIHFGIADAPGMYGDNGGGISVLVSGVPEPTAVAYVLSALGLVGWAVARRRPSC